MGTLRWFGDARQALSLGIALALFGNHPASSQALLQAATMSPATVIESLDRRVLEYAEQAARPNRDGAMGRNKERYVTVAFQRAALSLVFSGISKKDPALIQEGIGGIQYGFKRQREDGGFETGTAKGKRLQEVDELSSAAFFLAAVGMAHRLIEASPFEPQFRNELLELKPKIQRAMQWLAGRQQVLREYDAHTANRLVFDALAFTINGALLGDGSLQQTGEAFLEAALTMQQPDGIFPEKGGHDSSYQATTLLLLQYYWVFAPPPANAAEIFDAIARGIAWEKTRISSTGEVSAAGNTRTGLGQEEVLGRSKNINYLEAVQALLFWSVIAGSPDSQEIALRVFAHMTESQGSGDLKAKKDELEALSRQPGVPRTARHAVRQIYEKAEDAYRAKNFAEASRLLDYAIGLLKQYSN